MFDSLYPYFIYMFYKKIIPENLKKEAKLTAEAVVTRAHQVRNYYEDAIARDIHNFREGVIVAPLNIPENLQPNVNDVETPEGFLEVNNPLTSTRIDNNSAVSRTWREWFYEGINRATSFISEVTATVSRFVSCFIFTQKTEANNPNQEVSTDAESGATTVSSEDNRLQQRTQPIEEAQANSSAQEVNDDAERGRDNRLQQEVQPALNEGDSPEDGYELVLPDVESAVRGISPTWIGEGSPLF